MELLKKTITIKLKKGLSVDDIEIQILNQILDNTEHIPYPPTIEEAEAQTEGIDYPELDKVLTKEQAPLDVPPNFEAEIRIEKKDQRVSITKSIIESINEVKPQNRKELKDTLIKLGLQSSPAPFYLYPGPLPFDIVAFPLEISSPHSAGIAVPIFKITLDGLKPCYEYSSGNGTDQLQKIIEPAILGESVVRFFREGQFLDRNRLMYEDDKKGIVSSELTTSREQPVPQPPKSSKQEKLLTGEQRARLQQTLTTSKQVSHRLYGNNFSSEGYMAVIVGPLANKLEEEYYGNLYPENYRSYQEQEGPFNEGKIYGTWREEINSYTVTLYYCNHTLSNRGGYNEYSLIIPNELADSILPGIIKSPTILIALFKTIFVPEVTKRGYNPVAIKELNKLSKDPGEFHIPKQWCDDLQQLSPCKLIPYKDVPLKPSREAPPEQPKSSTPKTKPAIEIARDLIKNTYDLPEEYSKAIPVTIQVEFKDTREELTLRVTPTQTFEIEKLNRPDIYLSLKSKDFLYLLNETTLDAVQKVKNRIDLKGKTIKGKLIVREIKKRI